MKTPHKKGIVYVLSNKAFPDKNGEKILKIGRTTDLLFRLRVLNIGVPDDYKVEYALQLDADQYVLAETFLHQLFQHKNEKREFYRIDLKTAISKMEQMRVLTKGVNVTSLYQTGHETSSGKVKAVKKHPLNLIPKHNTRKARKVSPNPISRPKQVYAYISPMVHLSKRRKLATLSAKPSKSPV